MPERTSSHLRTLITHKENPPGGGLRGRLGWIGLAAPRVLAPHPGVRLLDVTAGEVELFDDLGEGSIIVGFTTLNAVFEDGDDAVQIETASATNLHGKREVKWWHGDDPLRVARRVRQLVGDEHA